MNATAADVAILDDTSLTDLARRALTACHGDIDAATRHLRALLHKDPELLMRLAESFEERNCRELVLRIQRSTRHRIWHAPAAAKTVFSGGGRVLALAEANRDRLMDFPLRSGKRLGAATGAEVRDEAASYGTAAADMAIKSRWLAAVAEAVQPRQLVRNVLTEAILQQLKEKASHA